MTRRSAILAAYMIGLTEIGCKDKKTTEMFKNFKVPEYCINSALVYLNLTREDRKTRIAMLQMDFEDAPNPETPLYGLIIKYKNKEVRVTIEEIMEALR